MTLKFIFDDNQWFLLRLSGTEPTFRIFYEFKNKEVGDKLTKEMKEYVNKIQEIGIEEQNAPKDYYVIRHKHEVKDEETGSVITILPDEEFSITTMCSFESKFINSQFASLDNMEDYTKEIAAARTFVFVRDIEPLLNLNLIKGGEHAVDAVRGKPAAQIARDIPFVRDTFTNMPDNTSRFYAAIDAYNHRSRRFGGVK